MKQWEKTIPPQWQIRLSESPECLIQLDTNWHTEEPGNCDNAKAADCQKTLDDFKAAANAEP